jgi:hypothetical protein
VLAPVAETSAALLARFRSAAARRPDDPEFIELIDKLHQASPEVRDWWPRHEILPLSSGTKRLYHSTLGDFTLQHVVLQVAEHPDQKPVTSRQTRATTTDCLNSLPVLTNQIAPWPALHVPVTPMAEKRR